jgi:hypothetical protein
MAAGDVGGVFFSSFEDVVDGCLATDSIGRHETFDDEVAPLLSLPEAPAAAVAAVGLTAVKVARV